MLTSCMCVNVMLPHGPTLKFTFNRSLYFKELWPVAYGWQTVERDITVEL